MAEGLVLNEQRHLARRELIYYLKVTDKKSGMELGRMGDIHEEGLLLLSEQMLPLNKSYEVSLELPKALQVEACKEVDMSIEVLWSRRGPKNSTYYENGAKIKTPNQHQKATIKTLIDLFAMPD